VNDKYQVHAAMCDAQRNRQASMNHARDQQST